MLRFQLIHVSKRGSWGLYQRGTSLVSNSTPCYLQIFHRINSFSVISFRVVSNAAYVMPQSYWEAIIITWVLKYNWVLEWVVSFTKNDVDNNLTTGIFKYIYRPQVFICLRMFSHEYQVLYSYFPIISGYSVGPCYTPYSPLWLQRHRCV